MLLIFLPLVCAPASLPGDCTCNIQCICKNLSRENTSRQSACIFQYIAGSTNCRYKKHETIWFFCPSVCYSMQINRIKPCRLTHVTNGSNKHKDTHTRKSEKKEQTVKIQSFMNISQHRKILYQTQFEREMNKQKGTQYTTNAHSASRIITLEKMQKNEHKQLGLPPFHFPNLRWGLPSQPLPSTPLRSRPLKSSWGTAVSSPKRGMGQSPSQNQFWCILALKSDIWRQQI